jgi:hypothetical protein
MANRHRVPTVFSIYMLDVICCALGCVILLWQVKHNEAEEQTAAAHKAEAEAQSAQADARSAQERWLAASTEVRSVNAEIDALRLALAEGRKQHQLLATDKAQLEKQRDAALRDIVLLEKERNEKERALALSKKDYEALRQEWAKLKEEQKLAALDLAKKVQANAELIAQLSAAAKKIETLEKQTADQKVDAAEAARRLAVQLARLQKLELQKLTLEKQASLLQAAQKDAQEKLATQHVRAKALMEDLDRTRKELTTSAKDTGTAQATIAALEKERTALVERARAIQAEADQRFAGIALTGKNVLFLVDMSGSMAMTDEKTPDPEKWPLVCETVVQLMRSLKGLQFFQVLLFSDRVRYPLGSPAAWLKYDPSETPKKTLAALKAVQPDGETNMHAVFAEAFRYREAALDTIYILSDGLPNAGENLPANLSEAERTTTLSKQLRSKLKNEWNRPIAGQPRVRINSIGFFFESPDVGAFLWALSREHDGSFVGMSK